MYDIDEAMDLIASAPRAWMEHEYVEPTIMAYASLDEAREFFEKRLGLILLERERPLSLSDLADEKRSLVLGEPGVGKSRLLERIHDHLRSKGLDTCLVRLRSPSATRQIDGFLLAVSGRPRSLLLDGLDEVKASELPAMIEKIEEISRKEEGLRLYVSARWVFATRYAKSFTEFRMLAIAPFTVEQVRKYLAQSGHSKERVDSLIVRMSLGHPMRVIQVPRYLSYLDRLLNKEGFDPAAGLCRNELFEHFIHSKLRLEEEKLSSDKVALKNRLLEKLALTLEIYQTNVLTKDELMTFFDTLRSDIKIAALAQVSLESLYDNTVLKVTGNQMDKVEFENTEFQEYLAARELTRFADPNRATFALAVDPEINEIYPSWYNTLAFLVDMQPDLLEQLVEFSGLRVDRFRALDEQFLHFLGRVDYRNIPAALRLRLLRDVMDYHERTLQRLPRGLADGLTGLLGSSAETYLKQRIDEIEMRTGATRTDVVRTVPLANAILAAAELLHSPEPLDRQYWRKRFLAYVQDKAEDGILRRHALAGLINLNDPSVLDSLGEVDDSDELFRQDLLIMCKSLAPNHPWSLNRFFLATKRREVQARYGLYAITSGDALKDLLQKLFADESFRRAFLDESSIYREHDGEFATRIGQSSEEEVRKLATDVLVRSVGSDEGYVNLDSPFLKELWRSLRKNNAGLVTEIVSRLAAGQDGKFALWHGTSLFAEVLELDDVAPFVAAMSAAGAQRAAYSVLARIKSLKRAGAERIYEAGGLLIPEECAKEAAQVESNSQRQAERAQKLLAKFRLKLEPSPGQYMLDVFAFYNSHAAELEGQITDAERERIIKLITESVFSNMDPADAKLTITTEGESNTYTTSASVQIFRDAIKAAQRLRVDITGFRRQILSFIPFAYGNDLTIIFELIKKIRPNELRPVIDVYLARDSDLWRHNPSSFIQAIKQYRVIDAVPVMQELAFESKWRTFEREQAIVVANGLELDAEFLRKVARAYWENEDRDERRLGETANGLLITTFGDRDAVVRRLSEIAKRAEPFDDDDQPSGHRMRVVGPLEDELHLERSFAKPLMNLTDPGFQGEYLALLDQAMLIWDRGPKFRAYAIYLWEIVCSYFNNLKETRSYEPLRSLEEKLGGLKERGGANWLASKVASLRHSYIAYLGKLDNIALAIAKQNEQLEYTPGKIRHTTDLFQQVKATLEKDIRRWIEEEGAYRGLGGRWGEDTAQTTLKTKIDNALLRRGFQVQIWREPQDLGGKRPDFVVQYGFVGPVIIEVKLTSNSDIQGSKLQNAPSYESMSRYMGAFGAEHGIFLVLDNTGAGNLPLIRSTYEEIPGVEVMTFGCHEKAFAGN